MTVASIALHSATDSHCGCLSLSKTRLIFIVSTSRNFYLCHTIPPRYRAILSCGYKKTSLKLKQYLFPHSTAFRSACLPLAGLGASLCRQPQQPEYRADEDKSNQRKGKVERAFEKVFIHVIACCLINTLFCPSFPNEEEYRVVVYFSSLALKNLILYTEYSNLSSKLRMINPNLIILF